jgi:hypothetical protein
MPNDVLLGKWGLKGLQEGRGVFPLRLCLYGDASGLPPAVMQAQDMGLLCAYKTIVLYTALYKQN